MNEHVEPKTDRVAVPDMFLNYSGIRVTDLTRSLKFYTELFGLTEVARGDLSSRGMGIFVLLQDPWSGQKLELNWYPPDSKFAVPYRPGDALDCIGFRVADLSHLMDQLLRAGVERAGESADFEIAGDHRVAFVKDPDGNWITLLERVNHSMPDTPPKGY